ncbi:response regulator transcription factor [Phenylobacterium sp.]|uniref:response regulator transcription factor n=1 Tax=Phenylobacterium sp. TaxID=1871053 RepID=UPI00120C11CC|nr:response regulator transcription factor [Phenylobacterium sp.]THD60612.1 MAG: response regulator transcription factor [Phenylobacterium sp.]
MKLLIVDDHPVLREGLAALLRQWGPETHILEARDAREAFDLLDRHEDIDVVVLDLLMPGLGGLAALAEFGRRRPALPVIVLSSSEDSQVARQAIAQGALGYVPKSANPNTLLLAIKLVLNGELYLPPLLLNEGGQDSLSLRHDTGGAEGARLTERQVDVLRLIGEGQSNPAIALALNLSEKTVKVHITGIFKALRVVNRSQAATVGRERGLI